MVRSTLNLIGCSAFANPNGKHVRGVIEAVDDHGIWIRQDPEESEGFEPGYELIGIPHGAVSVDVELDHLDEQAPRNEPSFNHVGHRAHAWPNGLNVRGTIVAADDYGCWIKQSADSEGARAAGDLIGVRYADVDIELGQLVGKADPDTA